MRAPADVRERGEDKNVVESTDQISFDRHNDDGVDLCPGLWSKV